MSTSYTIPALEAEQNLNFQAGRRISFEYKNWKGVAGTRKVEIVSIWFGSTEWHPEKQWFLRALDIEKGEKRDFALNDIILGETHA